jgi:hypothetical protein
MDRRKPGCQGASYGTDYSAAPHGAHEFLASRYAEPGECYGWTQQEGDASTLADRLDQVARDNARPLKMPPGIRLECHPLVVHVLQQLFVPSYGEFTASLSTGEDMMKPQIPVVVTAGMGRGQWRITADDGLIAEGAVRDG